MTENRETQEERKFGSWARHAVSVFELHERTSRRARELKMELADAVLLIHTDDIPEYVKRTDAIVKKQEQKLEDFTRKWKYNRDRAGVRTV